MNDAWFSGWTDVRSRFAISLSETNLSYRAIFVLADWVFAEDARTYRNYEKYFNKTSGSKGKSIVSYEQQFVTGKWEMRVIGRKNNMLVMNYYEKFPLTIKTKYQLIFNETLGMIEKGYHLHSSTRPLVIESAKRLDDKIRIQEKNVKR